MRGRRIRSARAALLPAQRNAEYPPGRQKARNFLQPFARTDIPDDYERKDEQLIVLIQKGTESRLKEVFGIEPGAVPNNDLATPDDEGSVLEGVSS